MRLKKKPKSKIKADFKNSKTFQDDLARMKGQEEMKNKILTLLRSSSANSYCIKHTHGVGSFVSHDEWAAWIEARL